MAKLRSMPSPPVERWQSLRERAGSDDEVDIDRFMKQKFGNKIVAMRCRELFAFANDGNPHPVAIEHSGSSVAVVYQGIERVQERNITTQRDPSVKIDLIDTEGKPLAVFSTSQGPLVADITEEQVRRMMENDSRSLAGHFGRIGLALDEPVVFGPLRNNSPEENGPPPTQLHVVQ